jgi:hypothetical protein
MLSCDVAEPEAVTVPAVPAETYPALTVGVILFEEFIVAVIRPAVLTVIPGVTEIVVAGVVAEPAETAFVAAAA